MQMAWFRRLYGFFIWLRAWANQKVDPIKRRLRKCVMCCGPGPGGSSRHLMRVRRRMRAAAS